MRLVLPVVGLAAVLAFGAPAGAQIFYNDTIHAAPGSEIPRPKAIESVMLVDRDIDTGALCGYINTGRNDHGRVKLTAVVERADGTRIKHKRRVRLENGEFQDCPMFAQTFKTEDVVTFTWKLGSLPRTLKPGQSLSTTSAIAKLEPEFFEAEAAELMEMAMHSVGERRLAVSGEGPRARTHFQQASFYHADEADDFPDTMFNSLVILDELAQSELCARFMTYKDVPAGAIVARFSVIRDGEVITQARGRGSLERREAVGDNIPLRGNFRACPAFADLQPGDVVFGRLDLSGLEAKGEEVWFSGYVSASNGLSVF